VSGYVTNSQNSKEQLQSYLTNPPVVGLVGLAGGVPADPQTHMPSWNQVTTYQTQLLSEIWPQLIERQKQADAAFNKRSHQQRKKKRLITIKGTIDCMVAHVYAALQLLASRPLDPVSGQLKWKAPTFYEMYKNKPGLQQLLNLNVFNNPTFKALTYDTAVAQQRYFQPSINDLNEPWVCRSQVQQYLHGKFGMIYQQNTRAMNALAIKLEGLTSTAKGRIKAAPVCNQQAVALDESRYSFPAAADDVTRSGAPRKRKRKITRDTAAAVKASRSDAPVVPLQDRCKTLRDHYTHYLKEYKPLEERYGNKWRQNVTVNGRLSKANSCYWGTRFPIYECVDHYVTELGTVDAAIAKAQPIWDSAGKNNIQLISAKFKLHLKNELGHTRKAGRPKRKP